MLPFLEQGNLYQQLYSTAVANNQYMGLASRGPGVSFFTSTPGVLCATPLAVLACPSDQLPSPPTTTFTFASGPNPGPYYAGVTSYAGNGGSNTPSLQGVFKQPGYNGTGNPPARISLLTITDGTSNTVLFGERSNYVPNWNAWTIACESVYVGVPFYVICSAWGIFPLSQPGPLARGDQPLNYNPPYDPTNPCGYDFDGRRYAYGSGHINGANFVFCDGSVHFISNAINNAAVVNGETILQALCSINGGEVVDASQY